MTASNSKTSTLSTLLFACLLSPVAFAVFTNSQVPSFRGQPDTQYAGWESFTSAFAGPNLPDDLATTATLATLVQTSPGAILTSSGNIYHPSLAPLYVVSDTVPGDLQEVVLQVSTWGAELDYPNVALVYTNGLGQLVNVAFSTHTELANYPAVGVNVESQFTWDLTSDPEQITNYELHFAGQVPNVSLDAVLLDARYASATGTAYCFGDGTGTGCPCGNQGGAGRGCANGTSVIGGHLQASGSTVVLNADLVLHGSGLPASITGLFFQGDATVNGGQGSPFGDGLLCTDSNIIRLEIVTTDAAGESSTTVDIVAAGGVSAGSSKNYQLWYRDPVSSPCSSGFNTTNALAIAWQ